jgi:hypothetical protein
MSNALRAMQNSRTRSCDTLSTNTKDAAAMGSLEIEVAAVIATPARKEGTADEGAEIVTTDVARVQLADMTSAGGRAAHAETKPEATRMTTDDAIEAVRPVKRIVTDIGEIDMTPEWIAKT